MAAVRINAFAAEGWQMEQLTASGARTEAVASELGLGG